MDKESILIIIVTYNGQNHIKKCLEDIELLPNSDIIIIDNNSIDNTKEIIKEHYPKIYLIEKEVNIGFGQANNIGLSIALEKGYEFVLLLNQDTYIQNHTIIKLIKELKTNNEYGIVSPLHYYSENKLQKSFSNHIKSNDKLIHDLEKNKFSESIYDLKFLNAAIWLIPAHCLLTVGGFSPSFYHYGEDDNYCHRAISKGYKIGVVPSTTAYHYSWEKINSFFKNNEDLNYLKNYIIKLSNPLVTTNRYKEPFLLFAKTTYYLLKLDKRYLHHLKCLKQVILLDYSYIKNNKNKSIFSETPFLNGLDLKE